MMAPKLTIAQQSRLRTLLGKRSHPERIDAFLKECGIEEADVDDAYAALNLRRTYLLDRYKMKRNVRVIGLLVMLISSGIPAFGGGQTTILVSIGLLTYGLALAITGSLTVYQP